jgi:hypothetical protein
MVRHLSPEYKSTPQPLVMFVSNVILRNEVTKNPSLIDYGTDSSLRSE